MDKKPMIPVNSGNYVALAKVAEHYSRSLPPTTIEVKLSAKALHELEDLERRTKLPRRYVIEQIIANTYYDCITTPAIVIDPETGIRIQGWRLAR